jgi:starvation-inducible DNA-binding protein
MATQPVLSLASSSDLNSNSALSVAQALNGLLADSFALYLKTKNFHWHVSGPHFRDYHLLLDEQAAQILAATDLIAERVRKQGHATLRSIGDIARRQSIRDNDAEYVSAADMLAELRADNLALVERLRDAKEIVDAGRDNATSGLIDGWTDEAEGRAWFLLEAGRNA